ncbi:MAG: oxidoreductase [Chloroflexi bacterium]|nr:oxidoreductase [Chloroflexota bacterium]
MRRRSLYFTAPRCAEICEEAVPEPTPSQVRVRTLLSAISPGTELLIYRGEAPTHLMADASIAALGGGLQFPLKYGYSCVGVVDALGAQVPAEWLGRRVFAFNPHEDVFTAHVSDLQIVPDDVATDDAVLLPNMESAVNFVMDARPWIGERVVVVGQGVVGLLTTALLSRMPLASLIGVEKLALRREWSMRMGAHAAVDPSDAAACVRIAECADVTFELSGAPAALDVALAATGYGGRVILGSWYGSKPVTVDLGGRFHRSRIRLEASQVSTLAPELSARWTKQRRLDVAWRMLREVRPSQLITTRLRFDDAQHGHRLLDEHAADVLQVVFEYEYI